MRVVQSNHIHQSFDWPVATHHRKESGEPYPGTLTNSLWLLRSRPDQVHKRQMRGDPPPLILQDASWLRGMVCHVDLA
jgi:hypothetical protein